MSEQYRENLAREIRTQLGEFNDDTKALYVLIERVVNLARRASTPENERPSHDNA